MASPPKYAIIILSPPPKYIIIINNGATKVQQNNNGTSTKITLPALDTIIFSLYMFECMYVCVCGNPPCNNVYIMKFHK